MPALILPVVERSNALKFKLVTPVPVPIATWFAVVSKSRVKFSLLPEAFWPVRVKIPLLAEAKPPVVPPIVRVPGINKLSVSSIMRWEFWLF